MRIKCPHCNGKGFSEINSAVNMTCGWCMGQGELDLEIVPTEPQTEQEYIQTCNTEQLAEWILNVWLDGALNVNAEFGLNEAQIENHKKYIVEWLKQPHHESVTNCNE